MDSYYQEKASYEQSHHDTALSLPGSMRSLNQHELSDHSSGGMSSSTEIEGKLRNSQQRRRVPVACGRCRKRKIKCSGDSGDGQGCTNCRSAGNNDCQFLRVNSHELNHHKSKWPYPNVGEAMTMAGFQRAPDYDLSSHIQAFPRPANLGLIPYEDEQSASYSQPHSYIMPGAPSGTLLEYGASSYSPKTWEPMMNSRASNGSIYPEPEANTLTQPSLANTYILSNQGLMSPNDLSQPIGTGITPIFSAEAPGPDRILPTPTSRSQQIPSTTAGFLPVDLTALSDPRNGTFWSPRLGSSSDQRQSPPHLLPSNDLFTSNPPSNKCVSPIPPALHFSFVPVSTTEDGSPTLCTAAPLAANNAAYPVLETLESPLEYPLPPEVRPNRSFSRDHQTSSSQRLLALTNEYSPEIYGYGSSDKIKARSTSTCTNMSRSTGASGTINSTSPDSSGLGDDGRCPVPMLVSGLPYARVPHRDSPACLSFNLLPDALPEPEYHRSVAKYVHRAPVEPLGNHGAY